MAICQWWHFVKSIRIQYLSIKNDENLWPSRTFSIHLEQMKDLTICCTCPQNGQDKTLPHPASGKMQVFRILVLLQSLLTTRAVKAQSLSVPSDGRQIEKYLQKSYQEYMEAINTDDRKTEEKFLQNLLTPEMRKKRARLACATDSDPMIRAQDVTEYSIQSVRCRHLSGCWYEVSYRPYPQDSTTYIPLRITTDSLGKTRISYVTPDWGNRNYGDYWFDIPEEKVIDHQDGKTFVETFYKSYAHTYIKMEPDLEQGLKHLRETYCTPAMQEKYVRSKKEVELEAPMFDPVIGNDDFDAFWYSSLQIHPTENKGCFTVSYSYTKLQVTLQCQDGKYKIADVELIP